MERRQKDAGIAEVLIFVRHPSCVWTAECPPAPWKLCVVDYRDAVRDLPMVSDHVCVNRLVRAAMSCSGEGLLTLAGAERDTKLRANGQFDPVYACCAKRR